MFNVVFLDIDGVLNSEEYYRERRIDRCAIDPVAVERLNRLTSATSAKIVVSSSWRQFGYAKVRDMLKGAGVAAHILDITPVLDDGSVIMRPVPRGHEIQDWLSRATRRLDKWIVLDDEDDMDGVKHRFIRTDHAVGLTDEDVDRAIELMQTPA